MAGRGSNILWAVIAATGVTGGCGGLFSCEPSSYDRLQSDRLDERIAGIRQAGNDRDEKAVPLLIDRLEDDDPAVRLFAIQALREITGQTLGYQCFAAEHDRRRAVTRWRNWRHASAGAPAVATAHKGG